MSTSPTSATSPANDAADTSAAAAAAAASAAAATTAFIAAAVAAAASLDVTNSASTDCYSPFSDTPAYHSLLITHHLTVTAAASARCHPGA